MEAGSHAGFRADLDPRPIGLDSSPPEIGAALLRNGVLRQVHALPGGNPGSAAAERSPGSRARQPKRVGRTEKSGATDEPDFALRSGAVGRLAYRERAVSLRGGVRLR